MQEYIAEMPTRVAGTPAQIGVITYEPDDYQPWIIDIEWEVCDRRGRPAPWLERKLTRHERNRIEGEVEQYMQEEKREEKGEARLSQYLLARGEQDF